MFSVKFLSALYFILFFYRSSSLNTFLCYRYIYAFKSGIFSKVQTYRFNQLFKTIFKRNFQYLRLIFKLNFNFNLLTIVSAQLCLPMGRKCRIGHLAAEAFSKQKQCYQVRIPVCKINVFEFYNKKPTIFQCYFNNNYSK